MSKFNQYHFIGQKQGEEVLLVTHRHWFNFFTHFIPVLGMLLFIILVNFLFYFIFPTAETNQVLILNFFTVSFLMITWLFASVIWLDQHLDVWIITDRRIVNIEQKGLFSREVSELEHIRIQDVTTDVKGFFPTIFNFGDLHIQTAAHEERFLFRKVPNPYAIKNLVMQLQKVQKKEEAYELGEVIQKKIRK